jgi:hypothetical protein
MDLLTSAIAEVDWWYLEKVFSPTETADAAAANDDND